MHVITKLADRVRYVFASRRRRRELAITSELLAHGFELSDLREPSFHDPA